MSTLGLLSKFITGGKIFEFCTWDTNSEMRHRVNHCWLRSSVISPKNAIIILKSKMVDGGVAENQMNGRKLDQKSQLSCAITTKW